MSSLSGPDAAHGVDPDTTIVDRTVRDVILAELAMIAARHAMDIDRGVIDRDFDIGIEGERAERLRL